MKEKNSSPWPTSKSDMSTDEELQPSESFHCTRKDTHTRNESHLSAIFKCTG